MVLKHSIRNIKMIMYNKVVMKKKLLQSLLFMKKTQTKKKVRNKINLVRLTKVV
jgi:ribosomal protein S24E